MPKDKYSAIWVSHSSMGDFIKCPRLYYLHNVYKDPKNKRKIGIVSKALSIGLVVHEVLESLANIKAEDRFKSSLLPSFEKAWKKVGGEKGGFISVEEEKEAKERALSMVKRVEENPGPLLQKAVRLKDKEGGELPYFYLSEEDNIILCGKVDWLVYEPVNDSVHILDFKTGKNEEDSDSLQLPIYNLLLKNLQKRKVNGASYWYLDKDNKPIEVSLPDIDDSYRMVSETAQKIKEARIKAQKESPKDVFVCPRGESGCVFCKPYEKILKGEGRYIGKGEMNRDMYIV